jgi:biotin carboxyl carrier protein
LARLELAGQTFQIEESSGRSGERRILVDGKSVKVEVLRELGRNPLDLLVKAGTRTLRVSVESTDNPDSFLVRLNGRLMPTRLAVIEESSGARERRNVQEGPVLLTAPMAGRIVALKTTVGTLAEEGQALVVLEAMKMENEVASPKNGTVREVYVQPGALVKPGDKLVLID